MATIARVEKLFDIFVNQSTRVTIIREKFSKKIEFSVKTRVRGTNFESAMD